jgi:acyl-coenzyme A thioesterase PaaI-like protein
MNTFLENARKIIAGELPPPPMNTLHGGGGVVQRGTTVGMAECTVTDQRGRLIAKATSTCLTQRGEQARGR